MQRASDPAPVGRLVLSVAVLGLLVGTWGVVRVSEQSARCAPCQGARLRRARGGGVRVALDPSLRVPPAPTLAQSHRPDDARPLVVEAERASDGLVVRIRPAGAGAEDVRLELAVDLGPDGAPRTRVRARVGDAVRTDPVGELVLDRRPDADGALAARFWVELDRRVWGARLPLCVSGTFRVEG